MYGRRFKLRFQTPIDWPACDSTGKTVRFDLDHRLSLMIGLFSHPDKKQKFIG